MPKRLKVPGSFRQILILESDKYRINRLINRYIYTLCFQPKNPALFYISINILYMIIKIFYNISVCYHVHFYYG